ncbi:MAG: hypothetical protein OXH27_11745 [Gammaproteobacteria bacterium]|nr:hypothetical protein [Gammaproteobacteria bacterium]
MNALVDHRNRLGQQQVLHLQGLGAADQDDVLYAIGTGETHPADDLPRAIGVQEQLAAAVEQALHGGEVEIERLAGVAHRVAEQCVQQFDLGLVVVVVDPFEPAGIRIAPVALEAGPMHVLAVVEPQRGVLPVPGVEHEDRRQPGNQAAFRGHLGGENAIETSGGNQFGVGVVGDRRTHAGVDVAFLDHVVGRADIGDLEQSERGVRQYEPRIDVAALHIDDEMAARVDAVGGRAHGGDDAFVEGDHAVADDCAVADVNDRADQGYGFALRRRRSRHYRIGGEGRGNQGQRANYLSQFTHLSFPLIRRDS